MDYLDYASLLRDLLQNGGELYVYPSSDSRDSFGVGHARDVASDYLSYPRSSQGHWRGQKRNPPIRASFGSCCAVNCRLQSHVAWHRHSSSRPDRFGPSTLVEAGSERLVFDCGRSCTTRLWQLKIPLGSVKLFITHLHSDHTVGIPDLWLTGWLSPPYGGRKEPFKVLGPKGTEEMMSYLEKAYQSDIRIRREKDDAMSPQGVAIAAKDFTEGVVYEENGVRVTAFKVHHGVVNKEAFGFRVDYKGHSVVISGDTGPTENFVKYAQGADVVVHEVGVAKPELLEKANWARKIMTFHSSPEDAGKEFSHIKPKLAVYTHFVMLSGEGVSEVTIPEIITRTRATYSGPLEAGEDLMSISIGDAVPFSEICIS